MDTSAGHLPAFVDPAAQDELTVTGPDAMTYLQSQIAQEIRQQAVGESQWTLVLEPNGKIVALARVTRTEAETYVFSVDAGFGQQLEARLNKFKIRVKADMALTLAEVSGPSDEYEAKRIDAGWPKMGAEIVPGETIPGVTGLTAVAVNFEKGCYPGQELVERMDSRGAQAPKSLRIVDVSAGTELGETVQDADGNDVGTITSINGTLGLGYIKRGADVGRAPNHVS